MAEPLSPQAQAVLDAAFGSCWESADLDKADIEVIAAAALRAAADQVVPEDLRECKTYTNEAIRLNLQRVRRRVLAIAAELEGSDES